MYGLKFAIGGDVSAWDASWSELHRALARAVDDELWGKTTLKSFETCWDVHTTLEFRLNNLSRHVGTFA